MSITLAQLSRDWLTLSQEYRPSAFWFWNDSLEPERLESSVREMARVGIREFLIHPVHGMEIEYLSPQYFDRLRYALGLAREHGLKVWIYDEFGWPSGNAGGLLLREHPEYRGWYLSYTRDDTGQVHAEPVQSGMVLDNTMGAPWTRCEGGYVDTMSDEAVRCFIDLTYERVYHECADFFGDVITGYFTDEPSCMVAEWKGDNPGSWTAVGMPWTPALPSMFRERFGYDIEPRYAELAGANPGQVKQDYWQLVKEIHAEAYHGQIGRWCGSHGVKYTGHLGEDYPIQQVRFAGSVFECLRHMDEPGIDYLGVGSEPDDRFIEMSLIPSVARHAGKDRVFCEAYGVSPLDLRLGPMLRRYQMMGLYGIDDIALMGFQHNTSGMRKHSYWPPIFTTAPWWEFYTSYRDAAARSLGLVSLGKRVSRYAILYPQHALEQVDLFTPFHSMDEPACVSMVELARAIYAAGETFDFVFPEVLHQAEVVDGSICFPHARYEAILAPAEVALFEKSRHQLDRLSSGGGQVLRDPTERISSVVSANSPLWADTVDIQQNGEPGDVRVYRTLYQDGEILAIRNVSARPLTAEVSPKVPCSEWDPTSGSVTPAPRLLNMRIEPHGTRYISLHDEILGDVSGHGDLEALPVDTAWRVIPERANTARISGLELRHPELGWLGAVSQPMVGDQGHRALNGIPLEFEGYTRIEMRGTFECSDVPDMLGIVFEDGHLESLVVNGSEVDLASAIHQPIWDETCRSADIRDLVVIGRNTVSGVLSYERFETSSRNQAFFANPPMPSCDVFLAGSFLLRDGVLAGDSGYANVLPIDLASYGLGEYDGIVRLDAVIDIDQPMGDRIAGLMVDLVSEDCVEVRIDGSSVGKRIMSPYCFELAGLSSGQHALSIRITSTAANILGLPSPWGIRSVYWLTR